MAMASHALCFSPTVSNPLHALCFSPTVSNPLHSESLDRSITLTAEECPAASHSRFLLFFTDTGLCLTPGSA